METTYRTAYVYTLGGRARKFISWAVPKQVTSN